MLLVEFSGLLNAGRQLIAPGPLYLHAPRLLPDHFVLVTAGVIAPWQPPGGASRGSGSSNQPQTAAALQLRPASHPCIHLQPDLSRGDVSSTSAGMKVALAGCHEIDSDLAMIFGLCLSHLHPLTAIR